MPMLVIGNNQQALGFTLLELMVVMMIVALASGLAIMALPRSETQQLDQEATRLIATLEAARQQSRARSLPITWEPVEGGFILDPPPPTPTPSFTSTSTSTSETKVPQTWLTQAIQAHIVQPKGVKKLQLGPEPLIQASVIELRLHDQTLRLGSDGLGSFALIQENEP